MIEINGRSVNTIATLRKSDMGNPKMMMISAYLLIHGKARYKTHKFLSSSRSLRVISIPKLYFSLVNSFMRI